MATVKVKFRPSIVTDKEGTVYYQIIHRRVSRQIKTGYRILADEWDENASAIRLDYTGNDERRNYLAMIQKRIDNDIKRIG